MLNQAVIDRSGSISYLAPRRLAEWLAAAVATNRKRHLHARHVRELRQLEPHVLFDIGVDVAALFATPPHIAKIETGIDLPSAD